MDETERRQLDADVAGCAAAHQALLGSLDEIVAAGAVGSDKPSLLPDWTIGHVLTHLARNANAFQHLIVGAAAGEIRAMYPTSEARDADIATGAPRPLGMIVDDVRRSVWALESAWATLGADGWAGFGLIRNGQIPITQIPWRRWREVAVHQVDLGLGHTPDEWPTEYVEADWARRSRERSSDGADAALPADVAAGAKARQLAWLLGRQSGFASAPPAF